MRSHSSSKVCSSGLFRSISRQLSALLVIIVTLTFTAPMWAQNATLTDDAQTSTSRPNRNFGAAQSLRVLGGNDRVFVKFTLPENFPPGTVGAHVGKATLKLFVNTVNNPGPLGVATVAGPWSEATITDATAPAMGLIIGFFNIFPTQHDQWLTLDVTSVVRGWIDNAATNQGLVLFAAGGGADLSFDSKENTTTSHQAQLEIVLNHAATADNAANAANAVTATNATQLGGVPAGNFVQTNNPALIAPRPPAAGSPNYIQNTTTQQTADFNISGNGTLGGTLSADRLNANTQFNLGGQRFLTQLGSIFTESILMGVGAGQNETLFADGSGRENTFIGARAGLSNTIGVNNSFLGHTAGAQNQTGNGNTYAGASAGYSDVSGKLNASFGAAAGQNMTDGSDNSFLGANAGGYGLTGKDNTFVGFSTGFSNAQANAGQATNMGTSNTLLGANAGLGTASLNHATAIGADALVFTSNTIVLGRNSDTVSVPGHLNTAIVAARIVDSGEFDLGGRRFVAANRPLLNTVVGGGTVNVGANNSFFGTTAGTSTTTGNANSFFGDTAGQSNQTGSRNSFFGSAAGLSNTSGSDNSFVGFFAGSSNQDGGLNSFFGVNAGRANVSGSRNSFFGFAAGSGNGLGSDNSFFGLSAGTANQDGGLNSFFGVQAGLSNTSGSHNSFFGMNAGKLNQRGIFNSFFGKNSGHDNDGDFNSFFGKDSGAATTTGSNNSFFGKEAGITNLTGSNNAAFGANADVADGLTNATAIGAGAVVNSSSTIMLGRSSGLDTVQVPGTLNTNIFSADTVNAKTQFNLSGLRFAANSGSLNTFVGQTAGIMTTGAANAFFGADAGTSNTDGFSNSFFGVDAGNANIHGFANSFFGAGAGSLSQGAYASYFGYRAGLMSQAGDNSFFGAFAGAQNVTGFGNSFFGNSAGGEGSQGRFNSFFGAAAGDKNIADDNSFFGVDAGQVNSTGEGNSFFGVNSGQSNTTGASNAFFGLGSGLSNTSGGANTFIGQFAGRDITDHFFNTYVGFAAGSGATGSGNTALGEAAGDFFFGQPGTGDSGTFIGISARPSVPGLQNAAAIGAQATVGASNSLVLGSIKGLNNATADTLVGIGTTNPTSKLTVVGLIETDSPAGGIEFPDGSIQKSAGISGNVVRTLNGLINDVTVTPGSPNVIITQAGNAVSIAAHADATAILNQTVLQSPANFNIDGTGTVGILFAPKFVASADYREAGGDTSILNDFGANLRVGPNAGLGPTGNFSTYVGFDAGSNGVAPGDQNSFFGYHAGQGATSGDGGNTFAGAFSGPLNHGNNNSYFGRNTGLSSDTGSNNTLIGANSNVAVAGLSNATAIGAGAIVAQSNSLVLGNNVNVGIGTSIPTSRFTVAGLMESTVGGVKFPDGTIQTTAATGAGGPIVKSLNGLNNDVVLAAGSNVTITPAGNTLTIASTAVVPNAILNQTTQQAAANFNIDGTGTANILNVATQYNQGGSRLIAEKDTLDGTSNLFAGLNAGASNVFAGFPSGFAQSGYNNAYFGFEAGKNNIDGYQNSFFGSQTGIGQAGQIGAAFQNAAFGALAGLPPDSATPSLDLPRANTRPRVPQMFSWDSKPANLTPSEIKTISSVMGPAIQTIAGLTMSLSAKGQARLTSAETTTLRWARMQMWHPEL